MLDFFRNIFNTDGFPPRWHCGSWDSGHGWLHIIADTLVFGAYVSIPVALIIFAWKKQREILFHRIVWLFAAFILLCGITHLIEASIFWYPWYRFSGIMKGTTAVVSWFTVAAIVKQLPTALTMPGLLTVNRQLENTLEQQRRAQRALQQSNGDLDQFAYVASHDLKAPLRSIKNLASWVQEDCQDILPQESNNHLSQLQDRVARLENLLADLLEYSRCGRDIATPEEIDVEQLATTLFSDVAGTQNKFALNIDGDLDKVYTWRVPFEQVLRNLLSNSIKHHDKEKGVIEISSQRNEDEITFFVKDDGPGIPAEFHKKVFGMFETLRSKDEVEGSGMGLAIVAKLVDRLQGRISIESSEGSGTTFIVSLPENPEQDTQPS